MSDDVLGRLSQRAIGERPVAAPRDEKPVVPADVPAYVDTLAEQSHDEESSRTPRPSIEPAAIVETRATLRHRASDDKPTTNTAVTMPQDESHRANVGLAQKAHAIAEPQPDSQPAAIRPPAVEIRDESAEAVPRAMPAVDAPTSANAKRARGTPADDQPKLPPDHVRPRAEKHVAIESTHDVRSRLRPDGKDSTDSDETIVNVHIGRIEVRAPQTSQPISRPQPQRTKTSSPSLASYLAARSRSRG